MVVDKVLYKVRAKDVNLDYMPNDEEFYFVLDISIGKRVHRCGHIKSHINNFSYVFLDETQLTNEQRCSFNIK